MAPQLAVVSGRVDNRGVGLWDRARAMLGIDKSKRAESPGDARPARRQNKPGRPPLPEVPAGSAATLEDALEARAAGRFGEARALFAAIDKGRGLRTVLRAAAALEDGDEAELVELLPALSGEQPAWHLELEVAAALADGERRRAMAKIAAGQGAPGWSLAWLAALSSDGDTQRRGLVDLLFEDASLARTVAARDLGVPGVVADNDGLRRYAAFAHGRDLVRKFGAERVADLLDRLRDHKP
jgi:hypothetical protein